jgi:hypothetical protein
MQTQARARHCPAWERFLQRVEGKGLLHDEVRDVMTSPQAIDEAVFRVRAAGSDHWVVYRDAAQEPVASFGDKASALAYALHLAHRRATQSSPARPAASQRSAGAYDATGQRDPH